MTRLAQAACRHAVHALLPGRFDAGRRDHPAILAARAGGRMAGHLDPARDAVPAQLRVVASGSTSRPSRRISPE